MFLVCHWYVLGMSNHTFDKPYTYQEHTHNLVWDVFYKDNLRINIHNIRLRFKDTINKAKTKGLKKTLFSLVNSIFKLRIRKFTQLILRKLL